LLIEPSRYDGIEVHIKLWGNRKGARGRDYGSDEDPTFSHRAKMNERIIKSGKSRLDEVPTLNMSGWANQAPRPNLLPLILIILIGDTQPERVQT